MEASKPFEKIARAALAPLEVGKQVLRTVNPLSSDGSYVERIEAEAKTERERVDTQIDALEIKAMANIWADEVLSRAARGEPNDEQVRSLRISIMAFPQDITIYDIWLKKEQIEGLMPYIEDLLPPE